MGPVKAGLGRNAPVRRNREVSPDWGRTVLGLAHHLRRKPGFAVANSHTACAGHGAFGILGKDYNMAGGANGQETGFNNSGLCGNPQGH